MPSQRNIEEQRRSGTARKNDRMAQLEAENEKLRTALKSKRAKKSRGK